MDNEYVHGADEMARKLQELQQYIDNDLPIRIGTEAVNHFKEGFQNEGFTDKSLQKWASRKIKRAGGTNSQKILSKSGELADSIEFRVEGQKIIISTDKKYAEIHNEGGVIAVTPQMRKYFWAQHYMAKEGGDADLADSWKALALAKEIKMPKRQIIGESEALNERIAIKIEGDLNRILN